MIHRKLLSLAAGLAVVGALAPTVRSGEPYLDLENNTGGISNLKAVGVGDIITVLIVETASANTTAKTDANTKSEVSGGPGLGFLNQVTEWGLTAENKFKGDGKSSRTGALQAQISTRIIEELPNGNLRLQGNRIVSINGEEQQITLTGLIRPQDLRADNSITSTLIADAEISYSGDGPIADAHSPGLLSRVVNFLF